VALTFPDGADTEGHDGHGDAPSTAAPKPPKPDAYKRVRGLPIEKTD
jgi:hypothetical protein